MKIYGTHKDLNFKTAQIETEGESKGAEGERESQSRKEGEVAVLLSGLSEVSSI